MMESSLKCSPAGPAVLEGLAEEADRLAQLLRTMQGHFSLIPHEALPEEMQQSGQALDCAEQGLSDFAVIFSNLAVASSPLPDSLVREAVASARQHRLRNPLHRNMVVADQAGEDIELF